MNKIFIGLMLLCGIYKEGLAQTAVSNEYPFNIPANSTGRYFWVDLDKGNKVQVYVDNIADLDKISNMDSIIYGFLKDLKKFEDSLKDESTVRRVDYNLDDAVNRKLRITQYRPVGNTYLVKDDEAAVLKTGQDTINFTGKTDFIANSLLRKKSRDTRYYKVTFLLNNLADISDYMNSIISRKIASIKNSATKKWENNDDRSYSPVADPSVKSNAVRGYYNPGGDYLTIRASADIQNYKSSFVPSASVGLVISLGGKNMTREIGLSSEFHFSFSKNAAGRTRTFMSRFLTLSYEKSNTKDKELKKINYDILSLSYSYLISNKGSLYEKNTSRISAGTLHLFEGRTKIQPVLYIGGLFKSVTPGIRLVQSF